MEDKTLSNFNMGSKQTLLKQTNSVKKKYLKLLYNWKREAKPSTRKALVFFFSSYKLKQKDLRENKAPSKNLSIAGCVYIENPVPTVTVNNFQVRFSNITCFFPLID